MGVAIAQKRSSTKSWAGSRCCVLAESRIRRSPPDQVGRCGKRLDVASLTPTINQVREVSRFVDTRLAMRLCWVSEELLASANAHVCAFAEVRVNHLGRRAGHPTGTNVKVVFRAFRDLPKYQVELGQQLHAERLALQTRRHSQTRHGS